MAAIRCLARLMPWVRRLNVRFVSTSADENYEYSRYAFKRMFYMRRHLLDEKGFKDEMAKWMREQRWHEAKHLFELWLAYEKPNLDAYNQYLRAKLMAWATPTHLIDLIDAMAYYDIEPNAESFSILFDSMDHKRKQDVYNSINYDMEPNTESFSILLNSMDHKRRQDVYNLIKKSYKRDGV